MKAFKTERWSDQQSNDPIQDIINAHNSMMIEAGFWDIQDWLVERCDRYYEIYMQYQNEQRQKHDLEQRSDLGR